MLEDLRGLWRTGVWQTRLGLLIVAAAATLHVASLLGLGWTTLQVPGMVLHLATIGYLFMLPRLPWRDRIAPIPATARIPGRLLWLAVVLGLYALGWFVGVFAFYGEGAPEPVGGGYAWVRHGEAVRALSPADVAWADARMLTIFSGMWMAFTLPLTLVAHRRAARRGDDAPESQTPAA